VAEIVQLDAARESNRGRPFLFETLPGAGEHPGEKR